MDTKDKNTEKIRTLEEIREAIAENDGLRLEPGVPDEVRKDLEKAALALKKIERELMDGTADRIIERMKEAAASVDGIAADVRAKVTKMNVPAKILEYFKKFVSLVSRVLAEAARW